jgi:hypothetical protein
MAYAGVVTLFVGNHSRRRAERRAADHGEGSALHLGRTQSPLLIKWPPVQVMRIEGAERISYEALLLTVAALLRDDVAWVEVVESDGSITAYSRNNSAHNHEG